MKMFVPGKFTVIARSMADIPERARATIDPKISSNLGERVSAIFPAFSESFPLATSAMDKYWAKPALAVKDMGDGWLPILYLEREDSNLFFNDPHPIYAFKSYFDVSMFPDEWAVFYQSMASFSITNNSYYSPLFWRNTLLPRGLDIDEFCNETRFKKSKLKRFEKRLGVTLKWGLRFWMIADSLDSFWIDEQHCDKQVYHVSGDEVDDAYMFRSPGRMLDCYLAHLVSGGRPKDFEFRKY